MPPVQAQASNSEQLQFRDIQFLDLQCLCNDEIHRATLCAQENQPMDALMPEIDRSIFRESASSRKQTLFQVKKNSSNCRLNSLQPPLNLENKSDLPKVLSNIFGNDAQASSQNFAKIPQKIKQGTSKNAGNDDDLHEIERPGKNLRVQKQIARNYHKQNAEAGTSNSNNTVIGRNNKNLCNVVPSHAYSIRSKISYPASLNNVIQDGSNSDDTTLGKTRINNDDDLEEEAFEPKCKRRLPELKSEAEVERFMKSTGGIWASQKKMRRKIVDADQYFEGFPQGWKILLGVRRKPNKLSIECRRYISPEGLRFTSHKEIAHHLSRTGESNDSKTVGESSSQISGKIHRPADNMPVPNKLAHHLSRAEKGNHAKTVGESSSKISEIKLEPSNNMPLRNKWAHHLKRAKQRNDVKTVGESSSKISGIKHRPADNVPFTNKRTHHLKIAKKENDAKTVRESSSKTSADNLPFTNKLSLLEQAIMLEPPCELSDDSSQVCQSQFISKCDDGTFGSSASTATSTDCHHSDIILDHENIAYSNVVNSGDLNNMHADVSEMETANFDDNPNDAIERSLVQEKVLNSKSKGIQGISNVNFGDANVSEMESYGFNDNPDDVIDHSLVLEKVLNFKPKDIKGISNVNSGDANVSKMEIDDNPSDAIEHELLAQEKVLNSKSEDIEAIPNVNSEDINNKDSNDVLEMETTSFSDNPDDATEHELLVQKKVLNSKSEDIQGIPDVNSGDLNNEDANVSEMETDNFDENPKDAIGHELLVQGKALNSESNDIEGISNADHDLGLSGSSVNFQQGGLAQNNNEFMSNLSYNNKEMEIQAIMPTSGNLEAISDEKEYLRENQMHMESKVIFSHEASETVQDVSATSSCDLTNAVCNALDMGEAAVVDATSGLLSMAQINNEISMPIKGQNMSETVLGKEEDVYKNQNHQNLLDIVDFSNLDEAVDSDLFSNLMDPLGQFDWSPQSP